MTNSKIQIINMESRGVSSAGIIVIGDEILKGHVQDTNSHYLAKELWGLGIRVVKLTVIGDDIDTIAQEVKLFSSQYDYVLTCGGIGPTHDDVTMEGIARSFGESTYPHPDLLKLFYNDSTPDINNDPLFKMVLVPKSTVIHGNSIVMCPLMVTHNVYTFAGLPSAMKDTFEHHKYIFTTNGSQSCFYLKEIFYSIQEEKIAKPLTDLQNEYKNVQIGSYPNDQSSSSHRVKVTLEGLEANLIDKAYCSLLLKISHEAVMSVKDSWNHPEEIKSSVEWLQSHMCSSSSSSSRLGIAPFSLLERIHQSLNILQEAIEKFRPENICIAFTGGKDCTVLLALYHALVEKVYGKGVITTKALYIVPDNSFSEVDEFIEQCAKRYNLDLLKINGSIKEGLGHLKSFHSNIEAILMGTRYSDPYSSELSPFSNTDPGWPQYTRVNCVLDWTYSQIWVFLRLFNVPYCKLYDKGYTSLGDNKNTKPNPALSSECHNCLQYQPAYYLIDETLERAGRTNGNFIMPQILSVSLLTM